MRLPTWLRQLLGQEEPEIISPLAEDQTPWPIEEQERRRKKMQDMIDSQTSFSPLQQQINQIQTIAEEIGVDPEPLVRQYFRETRFGKYMESPESIEATARGPFQITNNFTQKYAYPAYQELYIDDADRLDFGKSAEFAARHLKRFQDQLGSEEAALNAYYGSPEYSKQLQTDLADPELQEALEYLNSRRSLLDPRRKGR